MISLIVAMSQNRVIGKENGMPWHIPGELARFKKITSGHSIIMGRKTFESIGRVLPNRLNIIITCDTQAFLTSHPELVPPRRGKYSWGVSGTRKIDSRSEAGMTDFAVCHSLDEALQQAEKYYVAGRKYQEKIQNTKYEIHDNEDEVFIIGGGQIFAEAMPIADKLYLTLIHKDIEGDTYFPDYSLFTKELSREDHEHDGFRYSFLELVKE